MSGGRSEKAFKNLLFGTGAQIIQSIFPFITRTVFIYTLGAGYLGISSLFSSILSVLSLAELGIGNVVIYSLYKPVAERSTERIKAYIDFYKTIYRVIALVVLVIGLGLLPVLPYLVNLPENIEFITGYYVLYVLNSSASYLYIYKSSIINADQKQYIISSYTTISVVAMNIIQSVVLLLFKNFLFYLILQLVFTFLLNFFISRKADKLYGLKRKTGSKLTKEEKKAIFSDTKAMLMYKLGGTFLNSTDSVYISVLVNTITVGLYTNYTVLESFLNKFINLVYDALYASVGNLNATEGERKQKDIFDVLTVAFTWIASIGFSGYFLCANDVVELWIGEKYCISQTAVFALALRFYLPIVLYPTWMYRNTMGLFKQTKSILIYAGILNLILSWPLGKIMGLTGILLATSISRVLTSFWFEPYILYKYVFVQYRYAEYFKRILYSLLTVVATSIIGMTFGSSINAPIARLVLNVMVSILVPSIMMFFSYRTSKEFEYGVTMFKVKFRRK